jgi:ParB family chromosome partitioning protein
MASEAERLLKGSGWLPEVLRGHDLVGLEGAEGQGVSAPVSDAEQAENADLLAFCTANLLRH